MLETPSTSGISFANVYEPAEDSFLFLDALSKSTETKFLRQRFGSVATTRAPLILEVGCGSGVILAFVTANAPSLFGREDILTLSTDINEFACEATLATVMKNPGAKTSIFLDCIRGDLASCVRHQAVDILLFNPPYYPSEQVPVAPDTKDKGEELLSKDAKFQRDMQLLALATDGGTRGMETTDRLLNQLPIVLERSKGVAYVLLCAQNRPDEVKQMIRDWGQDWSVETVHDSGKQGGWEKLQIIRISRESQSR